MEQANVVSLDVPAEFVGQTICGSLMQDIINHNLKQGVISGNGWSFMMADRGILAIKVEGGDKCI